MINHTLDLVFRGNSNHFPPPATLGEHIGGELGSHFGVYGAVLGASVGRLLERKLLP